MLDKSTHVDCDDILHQYEQKLRAEEQIAELQQQISDSETAEMTGLKHHQHHHHHHQQQQQQRQQQISERDEEIEQLRRQLVDDCQLSAQRLEDTQRQVG